MFGSNNPFGQPSSSPFGSQSVFGQTSSTATNPFAPKPFGSTNAFGSQPGGGLVFGGTSTNMFGQAVSPLASQPAFGASSAPAFGSSIPSFGASSTPAFGSSTSSFGGSSVFGQKPAFGGFGSSPSQASPFGSTFQQTQPAFGSNLFGSSSQSAFGASSTPAFGASSTPAFGATTTPAFGATTAPAFGATTTPSFGSTSTPAFGSTTPLFGGTGAGFGASSTPSFGSSATPAFGSSSPLFGSSATPAFGTSSTPMFGSSSTPAFGSSTTPSFGFGSMPSFSQSTSAFGSTPFGTTPSPFGAQSSPFGAPTATATFGSPGIGQTAFGGQQVGSRVAPFTTTPETDGSTGSQTAGKLESISAMPVYKDKSFEELRWEDYQRGDKGGPNTSGQPAVVGMGFSAPTQANPFGSIGTSGQPAANPFSSATSSSLFGPKTPTFGSSGFGSSSTQVFSSPFSSSSPSPFGSTSTTPLFGAPSSAGFGLGSSPSIFGGATNPASTSAFGSSLTFGSTQSPGLFQSSTPSIGQTPSIFGQPSTGFQQTTPSFGSNPFGTPSTMFGGNMFSTSTPSLVPLNNTAGFGQATSSLSTGFQMPATAQTSNVNPFSGFGQPQSGGFGSPSNIFNPGSFVQSGAAPSNMVVQPAPVTNPFGTLPALPQMSIGRVGSAPSVQYGISSMPVAEMPSPVRISSLLTPRHLSQRRIRLPARKYHPKSDGQRVPFFADDEAAPTTPKADALFIPRENPRALIIRPIEQWPSRNTIEKDFILKETHPAIPNGQVSEQPSAPAFDETLAESPAENGHTREHIVNTPPPTSEHTSQKPNGVNHGQRGADSSFITISGHRAGEAAIAYEHGADIEALMPKLRRTDYYTEPRIQELAAKERADPGFCRRVRDFVVGRHGFGSIKFYGETDVRRLDLESIVQFYNREVTVYNDESKKPPVGQGLNKAAEVTLLNIKCTNKKTGEQYTEGTRVEKYRDMLMKKDAEQGTEFLSYDPVIGEWKFKVEHFSRYGLGDGDPVLL